MFEPSVISIGPYYRKCPYLRAMQEKKWWYLQCFLDHGSYTIKDCIKEIRELEKPARCCYSESFDMNSDEFVEMMVLDGCFIVEFFYKYIVERDDKAINEGWNSLIIENDLILLENQIPFFVIQRLNGFLGNPLDFEKIAGVLTRQKIPIKAPSNSPVIHHLLHLCHCYAVPEEHSSATQKEIPDPEQPFDAKQDEGMEMTIPCATELEDAGVKFKRQKKSDKLTEIAFDPAGCLIIPRLQIDDSVKPLFMNLIALEQCMSSQVPNHFSTYIMFLDKLVNTEHDVRILRQNAILDNMLSSEKEVTLFINQTGQSVQIQKNHYLADIFRRVNKYCKSRCHRYRARLCRDYFNNPWSILSLIAAIVLLLLTFAQTFMSMYSYIRPRS